MHVTLRWMKLPIIYVAICSNVFATLMLIHSAPCSHPDLQDQEAKSPSQDPSHVQSGSVILSSNSALKSSSCRLFYIFTLTEAIVYVYHFCNVLMEFQQWDNKAIILLLLLLLLLTGIRVCIGAWHRSIDSKRRLLHKQHSRAPVVKTTCDRRTAKRGTWTKLTTAS